MELRMKKDATYELTTEERSELRAEIIALLEEYGYTPTEYGVDKIIDEWLTNKGWIIELFKKHPNYNGKYQIVFDADYERTLNKNLVYDFSHWLKNAAKRTMLQEIKYKGVYTYSEINNIVCKLKRVVEYMREISYVGYYPEVNGRTYNETLKELNEWKEKLTDIMSNVNYKVENYTIYDAKQYALYSNAYYFANYVVERYFDSVVTEDVADKINGYFPDIKAREGQKLSKIVNKVCKLIGVDKDAEYNREYAKYSDTINPLLIKRHTIISCHPVDYLTMSFGNSWASCHTIDKNNKRRMPNSYDGMYSSGTLSYMLDESSFVFYTVDKGYNGTEFELQDKINRNMFHIGEDKLIQGRVYPQSTDGANGIYKQIREIVQNVIADCLEVPNMWKNVKGTSECYRMTESFGTHYRDYNEFGDSNVSYLKGDTDEVNTISINIGHKPICPSCGCTHSWCNCIECEDCYEDGICCYECGAYHDRDDMYLIDGEWYCSHCTFWCDYHDEREVGDYTYVENYGYVCEDGLDYGDFSYCEECGHWFYAYDGISTEDGNWYCDTDCANNAGYTDTSNGEWHPEEEVYYCEHCSSYVHEDNYNHELECCTDCEDEVAEETSETEEELALV